VIGPDDCWLLDLAPVLRLAPKATPAAVQASGSAKAAAEPLTEIAWSCRCGGRNYAHWDQCAKCGGPKR
jgi:hypothetical protein